MITVVFLIEQLAIALYVFILIGIALCFREWINARWDFRSTQFELERDIARYRSANAWTVMILLIEAFLIVVGVQLVVAPTVRAMENIQVAEVAAIEDIDFNTPTPAPRSTVVFDVDDVVFEEINPAEAIRATATEPPTPVGTIVPNAPEAIGCDTPNATLQIPTNGMRVFQITEIRGTAFTDNFAFYKLELRGGIYTNYISLDRGLNPLTDLGSLGQFNPTPYEPGLYQFRVVVFDVTETLRASCTINIYIEEPQPTRTPLPLPTVGVNP
ncbi:MAG: hypothetical protein MUF87_03580 [Anaerolineae bacterium]|jgi:hypothetical protein|nr:hypothetical protein [Anaerolineae bacterium]